MNENESTEIKPTGQVSSHVRFSKKETLQLEMDRLITGKTIPTLLKERYFKDGPIKPIFPVDEARHFLKLLSHLSRNLNQQTRYLHSGITGPALDEFQNLYRNINDLIENVSQSYGNSKNKIY